MNPFLRHHYHCRLFDLYVYISASLAFCFVLLIFTALIIGGVGRSLRSSSGQVQVKLDNLSSMIEETLSGLTDIRGLQCTRLYPQ
ncbi:MAG: hypothetical protein IPK46_14165 [Saprospiraceae bacterium]|nr:hypothetical protein [Saprospiraceae bacterium]